MDYVYLILSVVCISAGGVCGGFYNRKNDDKKSPIALYNLLFVSTTFVCWAILYATKFSFDVGVLLYAIPMGICYALATSSNINALKYGPVSLSTLFFQLSLIGVTIWGFFFWDTKATVFSVLGLCLTVAALVLCLYEKKQDGEEKKKLSAKWLMYALLSCVANAASSILQKTQQQKYNGEYGYMLMFFAMAIGLISFALTYAKSDKSDSKRMIQTTGWLPVVYGFTNVVLNLFVMLLATSSVSPSLIYPVIAVGGIAVNSVASLLVFKERLQWQQWVGIAVGALAVVFLSV